MGLDMYLSKDEYVSTYDSNDYGEVDRVVGFEITVKKELSNGTMKEETFKSGYPTHGLTILVPVAYWGKANQIHRFFIDSCADGYEMQTDMYVSGHTLEQLLERCKKVLANHSLAEELLPTTDGFFFGSLKYDEHYFQDLEETVEALKDLDFEADYRYHASW